MRVKMAERTKQGISPIAKIAIAISIFIKCEISIAIWK